MFLDRTMSYFIAAISNGGGAPEQALWGDLPLMIDVLLWMASVVAVIYLKI